MNDKIMPASGGLSGGHLADTLQAPAVDSFPHINQTVTFDCVFFSIFTTFQSLRGHKSGLIFHFIAHISLIHLVKVITRVSNI